MRTKHGLTVILSRAGVFAALILIFTAFTQIPLATGYIHLGDAFIFIACVYIGWAAVPAAAVGSALADIISGYAVYALPTFLIKGIMAAIAVGIFALFKKNARSASHNAQFREQGTGNREQVEDCHFEQSEQPKKKSRSIPPIWLMLVAFTVASLFMQGAYMAADAVLIGISWLESDGAYVFVFVEFLKGLVQSAIGVPLGIVAARLLKNLPSNVFMD
ncbi:hypothetical protein FACS1894211_04310 [Clostridia bacterium]|nr:hypothetical protein FACS1894211_04310 [Clostridia bacterium]